MTRFRHLIAAALLAVLAFAVPLSAQTTLDTTTLSAAISNATDQTLQLAATTNVEVGDLLLINKEAVRVNAIPVSGQVRVGRGTAATAANPHAYGELVTILPPGSTSATVPVNGAYCLSTAERYLPRVVLSGARVFQCLGATWVEQGAEVGSIVASFVQGGTAADALDTVFFMADRPYVVTKVDAVWSTAESTGAMAIQVEKLTGTTACASGVDLLSATIDATGTANTVNAGALVTTAGALQLAAGNRLCVDLTATPNEVVNMVVNVTLAPR